MMTVEALQFGQADLTSCDREPIHIPGSIQPHGVMLVVDREQLVIRQYAGAIRQLLGVEPDSLLHLSLSTLFEEPVLATLGECLGASAPTLAPSVLRGLRTRTGPLPLDVTLHLQGELGILELEPARRSPTITGDSLTQVKSMLAVLQSAGGFESCCHAAAAQVRATTGWDRVMIYQFLHDGSGKVVAEDKAEGLDGFFGLHFPAADIPQQARELYRRNWLRLIPDASYTPAPLAPGVRLGAPLDMSQCVLRSVSPIHLEYLRNMGVNASMSLSIVIGNQLWGLISCHHDTPRFMAADLRASCELFAQIFSLHMQAKIETEAARRRIAPLRVQEALAHRLPHAKDIAAELVNGKVTLLDLIPASGAAVWLDGHLHTLGQTPPAELIVELVAWLKAQSQLVVDTFQLGAVFPPALACAATASGLLAVSLSRKTPDYVMWFRPEVVRTVTWAGNPEKCIEVGPHGDRLTPRKSFVAWQEEVQQQSVPWDAVDREVALAFRVWLQESVLQQMDLARQEREAAFAHQSLLMAELDHRVKNILANIHALVKQTKAGAHSLEDFALSLELRIRAMVNAHSLMAATRWEGASVRRLVEEELAPFRRTKDDNLCITGDDLMLSTGAAMPFTMVVHELVSNAAKYGALSTAAGGVDIDWYREGGDGALVLTWKERNGPPVTPPTRRGFGSVVIERSLRHEINGHCALTFDADGVGCVITIPAGHVVPEQESEARHV